MRELYWSLYPIRSKRVVCKINSIPTDLFWSRIRKEEWEYSCLICKTFSEKTQEGSSNHWGYLETTTAELRACALSIKPFGSMTPSLSLKNWENVHHPLRSLNQKRGAVYVCVVQRSEPAFDRLISTSRSNYRPRLSLYLHLK